MDNTTQNEYAENLKGLSHAQAANFAFEAIQGAVDTCLLAQPQVSIDSLDFIPTRQLIQDVQAQTADIANDLAAEGYTDAAQMLRMSTGDYVYEYLDQLAREGDVQLMLVASKGDYDPLPVEHTRDNPTADLGFDTLMVAWTNSDDFDDDGEDWECYDVTGSQMPTVAEAW